jgi:hypothetical protein
MQSGKSFTVGEIAEGLWISEESEHIYKICEYLAANKKIQIHKSL